MKNTADEGIGSIYTFMGIIASILKGGKCIIGVFFFALY